jgi:hypothetical protein
MKPRLQDIRMRIQITDADIDPDIAKDTAMNADIATDAGIRHG